MNPTTTISLSTFDWVALLSGIASLILAVIAIWLAVRFFISSKAAEKEASNLLSKLEAQTQLLSKVTGRMLDKYVTYSTQPRQADETTVLLTQLISGATFANGLLNKGPTVRNAPAMQELTTLYIAVMYQAAITNILLQPMLPEDIGSLDSESPWIRTLIERSYSDFMVAANWLTLTVVNTSAQAPPRPTTMKLWDLIKVQLRILQAYTLRELKHNKQLLTL